MTATTDGILAAAVQFGIDCRADQAAADQAIVDQLQIDKAALVGENTALQGQVATLQAELDALQNPPAPASGTLWGLSDNGSSADATKATMAMWPHAKVHRIYQGAAAPVPWGQHPQLSLLPAGTKVVYSFGGDPQGVLAGKYDAAIRACVQSGPAPASGKHDFVYDHEPENDMAGSLFKQATAHVAAVVHSVPNSTWRSSSIFMAYSASTASHRNLDDWYCPDVDAIGIDCYNAPYLALALKWVQGKGKPWYIGELGQNLSTDDAVVGWIRDKIIPTWAGAAPEAVCWFNHGTDVLAQRPHTVAYLAGLNPAG